MKTDISVLFKVPEKAYTILEMIADQNNQVDLYCMGGNEILLAANVVELESDFHFEDEDDNWQDIEDFEDMPF
jgi:hemerythrin superfamily protein